MSNVKPEYIVALYLAKYSPKSYEHLGFHSWKDCFDRCADHFKIKPMTMKNLRDTFDGIYPNERKGWYQRELRPMAFETYQKYDNKSHAQLLSVCKGQLT